jgi:GT2 family glycosyltransferase
MKSEEFEIVVVDDGSEDDTLSVCEMLSREIPNLRYVTAGRKIGPPSAANLGIRSSSGDYIIFTDDDCIARKDWVERMKEALDREPVVAGAVASPTASYVKLCHNIAEFHAVMAGRKSEYVDFIAGANMGFRRSILEELDGFKAPFIALDMELILRARERGYRTYYAKDAIVTHDPNRSSFRNIFIYSFRHAGVTILLRNKHRELLRTPFVLRSPLLLLLASPLIALVVTARIYLTNPAIRKHLLIAPVVFGLKVAWCWGAAHELLSYRREKAGK